MLLASDIQLVLVMMAVAQKTAAAGRRPEREHPRQASLTVGLRPDQPAHLALRGCPFDVSKYRLVVEVVLVGQLAVAEQLVGGC